jgi:hypothetical protein
MRAVLDRLSDCSETEQLTVNEIIVLFKGRVIFRQYIPKIHKLFGIKLCNLCDNK